MRRSSSWASLVASFLLVALVVCSCSFVAPASASSDPAADPTSDVLTLTDATFDELTSSGSWLLEFYAPWCGHCKTLAPQFEAAARQLRGTGVHLAKIDATLQTALAQRYDIKGFPSLKFFREGEIRNYNGARTTEGMVAFGTEMSLPAVSVLGSVKELQGLADKYPVSIVFFGGQGVERRLFDSLAYRLQGSLKFLRVDKSAASAAIHAAAGVSAEDTPLLLVVTSHGDLGESSAARYAGPWVESSLRDFVLRHKLPLISSLDQANFDDVTSSGSGKRVVYAVVDQRSPANLNAASKASVEKSAAFIESLYPLAKSPAFRDAFVFASIDGVKYSKYVSQFGVVVGEGSGASGAGADVSSLPTVVVLEKELDYFYAPSPRGGADGSDGAVHPIGSAEDVDRFLTGVLGGTVALQGTVPWYNPSRYLKLLEKVLARLPVWQVAILATLLMLAIVLAMFYCCFSGIDSFTPEEREAYIAEEKAALALAAKIDAASANPAGASAASTASTTSSSKEEGGLRSRKGKADQ